MLERTLARARRPDEFQRSEVITTASRFQACWSRRSIGRGALYRQGPVRETRERARGVIDGPEQVRRQPATNARGAWPRRRIRSRERRPAVEAGRRESARGRPARRGIDYKGGCYMKSDPSRRVLRRWPAVAVVAAAFVALMSAPLQASAEPPSRSVMPYDGLSATQKAALREIAQDTWKFFAEDVDPDTNLPLDNVTYAGGSSTPTATAATPRRRTSACTSGRSWPRTTSD